MVQRKLSVFPNTVFPNTVFPNTVFHLYLRPFRDDEPVFLQQAHMLGDGIAGELQDFRHVEYIISASKAPFGWSALVSCRDLKSLTVPKGTEVSEDVFGSGEEEHQLFRKLNIQICVNEYSSLSPTGKGTVHRDRPFSCYGC